jgi:hypothetical protein
MQRLTKDSVNQFIEQFEPRFDTFNEILDPGNDIDASQIRLGFEILNLEGYTSYPQGGYLTIDEDGFPKGFTFREFEDTFLVASPIDLESTSGLQKLGKLGTQPAPDDGPDAIASEGRTVETIGPDDVGEVDASELVGGDDAGEPDSGVSGETSQEGEEDTEKGG